MPRLDLFLRQGLSCVRNSPSRLSRLASEAQRSACLHPPVGGGWVPSYRSVQVLAANSSLLLLDLATSQPWFGPLNTAPIKWLFWWLFPIPYFPVDVYSLCLWASTYASSVINPCTSMTYHPSISLSIICPSMYHIICLIFIKHIFAEIWLTICRNHLSEEVQLLLF